MRIIHSENIYGLDIDAETRCLHWHSDLDIVAIKFKCCGRWYPCYECHESVAGHEPRIWPTGERGEKAVLCGKCGYQLSINEYLQSGAQCTVCKSAFNPGCARHYDLYFEMPGTSPAEA